MRISDWSSDVCSSDLEAKAQAARAQAEQHRAMQAMADSFEETVGALVEGIAAAATELAAAAGTMTAAADQTNAQDRKSVEWGKSVSESVVLGGCWYIKKKTNDNARKKRKRK